MPKRITINVNEKFHKEIKQRSLDRGITMTRYVYNAIWKQLQIELKYEQESHENTTI